MKTRRGYRIIERLAKLAGKTTVEYLQWIFANHTKMASAELELGIARQTILNAANRHGVSRNKTDDFEYEGVIDSLAGHCAKHGLNFDNVSMYHKRRKVSGAQALDRARAI